MYPLRMNESPNNMSQPLIIPISQEETKATEYELINPQPPKIPAQALRNALPDRSSIANDFSRSESINNRLIPSSHATINDLPTKTNPPESQKLPYLIRHEPQDAKREAQSSQRAPQFVITQYLGRFIPPEGAEGINVDRLMPYLEFVTTIYEKAFQNASFKLYLVWLCLYPVLTIILMTAPFIYFRSSWDTKYPLQGLIGTLVITCWLYSVYQAYKMYKVVQDKDQKGSASMITMMTVYAVVNSLVIVYFHLQETPEDKDKAQTLQNVLGTHILAVILHILLTLIPALWVKKAITKFHRFVFLKNNLQDPEKTGIYYQYVFELLHEISEKGLLYPIKAPKYDDKKELQKGIIKAFADGFDATNIS